MSGILTDNSARSSGLVKAASGGAGVAFQESIKTSEVGEASIPFSTILINSSRV